MGSLSRTLRRRNGQRSTTLLDVLLFGSAEAPDDECRAERQRLLTEFRWALDEMNAPNPAAGLGKLQKHYEKWDHKQESRACRMLDDVMALRGVEAEMRAERKAADAP